MARSGRRKRGCSILILRVSGILHVGCHAVHTRALPNCPHLLQMEDGVDALTEAWPLTKALAALEASEKELHMQV